ncbi:MAG: hypothetical protein U0264_13415 [Candidatus Kapaibacterium sp.]
MCQYINIIVPTDIKLDKIKLLLTKHGLGSRPFQNNFILRQIAKGGQLVNTTANNCDCSSVIGSAARSAHSDVQLTDIERLKRKGWSEKKIKKWVENKAKTNTQIKEWDRERDQWTMFLEEAMKENNIGKLGLFIHWYNGNMEDEEVLFNRKEKVSLMTFKDDTLDKLKYDILYEVIP